MFMIFIPCLKEVPCSLKVAVATSLCWRILRGSAMQKEYDRDSSVVTLQSAPSYATLFHTSWANASI